MIESGTWPAEGLTRIPYWVYQDEDVYAQEQARIFRGATWTFLGLEAEVPNAGDYKTTFLGEMPVVLARDDAGQDRPVHPPGVGALGQGHQGRQRHRRLRWKRT